MLCVMCVNFLTAVVTVVVYPLLSWGTDLVYASTVKGVFFWRDEDVTNRDIDDANPCFSRECDANRNTYAPFYYARTIVCVLRGSLLSSRSLGTGTSTNVSVELMALPCLKYYYFCAY